VLPPQIPPDGTPDPISGFQFDRLGIRVPAIFVSPWIDGGTVIHTQYEHASIPATVASQFIADPAQRNLTVREQGANLFTTDPNLLTLAAPRQDSFYFTMEAEAAPPGATKVSMAAPPAEAFNPGRDMGVLLRDHVQELSRLEQQLPPDQRTNVDVANLVSEQDASDYIGRVTPLLRAQGLMRGQP